jgi:hypothetical protein
LEVLAMKKLIRLVVVLGVLIVVGLVAAYLYIDVLAKTAIERGSTYALGVETKLDSARLRIFQGELAMGGLNVANPQGYSSPHFLKMKTGDVAVTLGSLREDVVQVPTLALAEIDINLEKKAQQSNYQVILDNLKKLESDKPAGAEGEGKRYIVNDLQIHKIVLHVDMLGGGDFTKVNVPIDEIRLKNVGSETRRGVLLSELSGVIIKAILAAAADKAGGIIPADITADLKSRLSQLQDLEQIADIEKLGELLKPGADLGKEVEQIGEKAKEDLGKAIGDLLGGSNKKE